MKEQSDKLIDLLPKELFEHTYKINEVSDGKFAPMLLDRYICINIIDDIDIACGMTSKYRNKNTLSETFSKEQSLNIVLDNYNISSIENKWMREKLGLPELVLNREDIKINYINK